MLERVPADAVSGVWPAAWSGALLAFEVSGPRAAWLSGARAAEVAALLARAGLAGGVMRLTVGREAAAFVGLAAGRPAFAPSMLSCVGLTSGPLALGRSCNALSGTFPMFCATGNECCSVLFDAAVSPLCSVAYRGIPTPLRP